MAVIASMQYRMSFYSVCFVIDFFMFNRKITKLFLTDKVLSQVLAMFYSTKLQSSGAKNCQCSIVLSLLANFSIFDRSISARFLTSSIFGLLSKLNENKFLSEGLCQ